MSTSVTIAIMMISNDEPEIYQTLPPKQETFLDADPDLLIKQAPNEPAYLPNSKFFMPGPFINVDRTSPFFSKIVPINIDPGIFYIPKARSKTDFRELKEVSANNKIDCNLNKRFPDPENHSTWLIHQ